MQKFKTLVTSRLTVLIGGVVLALGMAWPLIATAQDESDKAKDPDPHAQHKQPPRDHNLARQVAELRVKVARLENALEQIQAPGMTRMAGKPSSDMGPMGGKGGTKPSMGGMDDAASKMDGMSVKKKPAGGMGMMDMDEMKGMGAMGAGKARMGGMSGGAEDMDMMKMKGMMGMAPKGAGGMAGMKSMVKPQMQAALPGFPGASAIYHVGVTGFFLNHPEHIDLTPNQKGDLDRLKGKAVLAKTSAQRKIDEAEQELWTLTSADEPDAAKIEAKIQEIEKLRGAQRMALIRAVGDAAKLLTDEQRQALVGTIADETAKPDPHAGHTP